MHEHFELVKPVNGVVAIEFTIRNSAPIDSDEDMWPMWTGRTLRHISAQNVSGTSDRRLGGDREAGRVGPVGEGEIEHANSGLCRLTPDLHGPAAPGGHATHGEPFQLAPSRTRSRLVGSRAAVNIVDFDDSVETNPIEPRAKPRAAKRGIA